MLWVRGTGHRIHDTLVLVLAIGYMYWCSPLHIYHGIPYVLRRERRPASLDPGVSIPSITINTPLNARARVYSSTYSAIYGINTYPSGPHPRDPGVCRGGGGDQLEGIATSTLPMVLSP